MLEDGVLKVVAFTVYIFEVIKFVFKVIAEEFR